MGLDRMEAEEARVAAYLKHPGARTSTTEVVAWVWPAELGTAFALFMLVAVGFVWRRRRKSTLPAI